MLDAPPADLMPAAPVLSPSSVAPSVPAQHTLSAQEVQRLTEQPMRRRLLALIETRPGIHASELCRESGEPWGTVQYHLSLLSKGALVNAVEAGRERRFFPPNMEPQKMRMLALMNQGRRQEIAGFIRGHPGTRQVDVCDALDLSRKTFRHAVGPMVEQGLIQEKRGLQSNRYFPLERLGPLMDDLAHPAAAPDVNLQ